MISKIKASIQQQLDRDFDEWNENRGNYWHKRFCIALQLLGLTYGMIIVALISILQM